MAYSVIPKVRRDGSILLEDGGGTSLVVAYESGDFSFEWPNDADQTVIRDRSSICTVRKGDEPVITGSFSFYFRDFTDNEVGGVRDFVTKENVYSGNTSAGATGTPYVEFYCVDITYEVDGTIDGNTVSNPKAKFSRCVCTFSFSEGDPSAYSLSFTCYGGVAYTKGS